MPAKISSKISITNTPQAKDDSSSVAEGSSTWLNVLANDLGGASISIYSLSSETKETATAASILAQGKVGTIETRLGAVASIDSQGGLSGISYDTSGATGDRLDELNEGEEITDTFSYVILLGSGAFAIATVTVTITGTNDAPVARGFSAQISEDLVLGGTLIGDDIDREDNATTLRFEVVDQPGGGTVAIVGNTYTFTPGSSFQDLDQGETSTIEFTYVAIDFRGARSEPATVTITVIGSDDAIPVIDGYIANALVFRDANENGVLDDGEAHTVTNDQGVFEGLDGTGRIVATANFVNGVNVSRDLSTGQAFTGMLSAPVGASVVTPLTTLIDALVNALTPAGETATAEQIALVNDQLAAALGLPPGTQLTDLDPIAVIADSNSSASEVAAAFEVQKAAVQVANILAVVSGALEAADADDAAALATDALVAQFLGANGEVQAVDLSDAATLTSVVTAAADAGGVTAAVGDQAAAIGTALGNINGVIGDTAVGDDGLAALAAVVTAQIVAQGDLVEATEAAVSGGADLDSDAFSDAALTEKLDDAADEVAVIVPTTPDPQALGTPGRPLIDDGNRVSASEASDGIVVTIGYSDTSGVVAGDVLRLFLGNGQVASYTLTAADVPPAGQSFMHAFVVAPGVLGDDGVKVFAAQFASADGTRESAKSLPTVVTLDTVAQRPEITAVEGPIVSVLDAADGTQLVGTIESGSAVTVTVSNGALTLTRQGVVDGTSFTVDLSADDLADLGEGYVSYSATTTDAAGNAAASLTGQFFYTRQPIVDSTARIDTGAAIAEVEDDESVAVTASPGGGFVVRWVIGGGEEDAIAGIAFQRYAADGAKDGPIVVLQGLPQDVLNGASDDGDVTSLANGNFVLTYGVEREVAEQFFVASRSVAGAPSEVPYALIGVPLGIGNATVPGVTYELRGLNAAGTAQQIAPLTVVNGQIEITQAILDQFSNDNRLTLVAKNLQVGQTVNLQVVTEQDQVIDLDAPLQATAISVTAAPPFVGVGALGRVESFDVDQALGTNISYQLVVRPHVGAFNVDLSGIPGATAQQNGNIIITGVVPSATGVIEVPALLLDRLGDQDVRVSLLAFGVTAGTTFIATAYSRPAIAAAEGVFVQLFDASGEAIGAAQPRIDATHPADIDDDVDGGIGVSPLADGGYIVRWAADEEGLAIQRFDAQGAKVGGVVILQGIPEWVEEAEELSYDLTPLENGGYALSFAIEHQTAGRGFGGALTANIERVFNLVGEPNFLVVDAAPAGTTFAIRGRNSANQVIDVPVTAVDGEIVITQAILDSFVNDSRLSIVVRSPTAGTVSLYVEVEGIRVVDLDAPLQGVAGPTAAAGNGIIGMGAVGRLEYVDLDAYTLAAGQSLRGNFTISALSPYGIRVDDIPGAVLNGDGTIVVNSVLADASGIIRVPALLLERLGDQDVSISVVVFGLAANSTLASTAYGRPYAPAPEGVFVQMFDADGVAFSQPTVRIDGPGLDSETDDGTLGASPTAEGGVAVRWVFDADGDGEGDGIAVQKFAADGTAIGSAVVLDLPQNLLDADEVGFDLAALDNGGYALSYVFGQEGHDRFASVAAAPTGANQTATIPLVGKVTFVSVSNEGSLFTPPTFTLIGVGNDGLPHSVAVTLANGGIEITQTILDQFGADNRLALQITNLQPGHAFGFYFEAIQDVVYDLADPLAEVAVSAVAVASPNGGRAILGNVFGRVEAFHIDSATFPVGATRSYVLIITPVEGADTLDITGLAGASRLPTGQVIVPVSPDGAGDIDVPQSILDQLGSDDASIQLLVQGLEVGSTLEGTVSVREGHSAPEGLFVITYDAEGNVVPSELELTGTSGDDALVGGPGDDVLTALAGSDVLTGGDGADVFDFDSILGGTKTITDFQPGVDTIDVSGIDADSASAGDQAFVFHNDGSPHANGLWATTDGSVTTIFGDTDGDVSTIEFQVVLTNLAAPLASADFVP